jgi:hypothetical protein
MANTLNRGFLIKEENKLSTETSKNAFLLNDKNFDYNITRYPHDLGLAEFGKGHYIVFHVLQQRESQYKTQNNPTGGEAVFNGKLEAATRSVAGGGYYNENYKDGVQGLYNWAGVGATTNSQEGPRDTGFGSTITNTGRALGSFLGKALGSNGDFKKWSDNIGKPEFVRTVEKTKQSIALYMPDNLNFVQAQNYDDVSPGGNFITALLSGGKGVFDTLNEYNKAKSVMSPEQAGSDLFRNLSPFAASFLGSTLDKFGGGGAGRLFAAAGTGVVSNPMIEVIYSSPSLRQFRFDFAFYPQSQREGVAVQKIIQSFQYHQAPEVSNIGGTSGYFLVPPSEFDIEFYYNGSENINIPSISTCVLTSLDVDYAPNGFSAYEIPGESGTSYGGTGMPVAIKMSLNFKETSIVFKSSRQFNENLGQGN